ncbi:phage tail assembly chaperone [Erythrobacter oryzae]|uniref:phage tail assembly chaperone n=1 Tax=Erythrobacter oryzae TaxID=3019556 RepID=UPI002554E2C1|nr:phage tail assembly chaperone [Erythrobacter sp. COR-2]
MTARFGDAALRWAGLAAQALGWRPAEFWAATPIELATALAPPDDLSSLPPPSREAIARMMERDADGQ